MECLCESTPDLSLDNSSITVAHKGASHHRSQKNFQELRIWTQVHS